MPRSDDELVRALDEIGYELEMLGQTAMRLHSLEDWPYDLQNALIEAWLVHARALIEFLLGRSTHSGDIRLSDFPGGWSLDMSPRRTRLTEVRSDANKHLAHLTWERAAADVSPAEWALGQTLDDIVEAIGDWSTSLGPVQARVPARFLLGLKIARDSRNWIRGDID